MPARRVPASLMLLALLWPPLAWAADPLARISGPSRLAADPDSKTASLLLLATDSVSDGPLVWQYLNNKTKKFPTFTGDDGRKGVMLAATGLGVGQHQFAVMASGKAKDAAPDAPMLVDFSILIVDVYLPAPPAPAPVVVPPVVVPPVNPPVVPVLPPGPGPTPSPGPVGNMRAVLLYESSDKMTPAQYNAIYSANGIFPYLNAKTLKDSDGNPSWRAWDKDVDVTGEPPEWRDAMAKAKADPVAIPKLVVFSGNTLAASRPVTSLADAMAFLKTMGGD